MNRSDRDEALGRFAERWRRWAARPPKISPQIAAQRVTARLPETRRGSGLPLPLRPLGYWAAAAMLVLALAGAWLLSGPGAPEVAPGAAGAAVPLGEGVVLLWLDPETPLYMNLTPPHAAGASEGDG